MPRFSFNSQVILASHEDRYEAQRQAVVVITTLIEHDENYIADQTELVKALKSVWQSDLNKVSTNVSGILIVNQRL